MPHMSLKLIVGEGRRSCGDFSVSSVLKVIATGVDVVVALGTLRLGEHFPPLDRS